MQEEYYKNLNLEDLEGEVWKDVVGYEGYMVSNLGRVKALERTIIIRKGKRTKEYRKTQKAHILHQLDNGRGYLNVSLSKNGEMRHHYVHRLVCRAFIGEPDGLEVNHKTKNKTINTVECLEYVTHKENYDYSKEDILAANQRKCYMYDSEGVFVKEYCSVTEAAKDNNLAPPTIVNSCTRKCKQGHNIHFRYEKKERIYIPPRYYYKVEMCDANGERIIVFDNADKAAEHLGVAKNTVVCTCIGRQRTCKGYKLRYIK